MSMNLHCNKIDLWQMSTSKSFMFLKAGEPRKVLLAYLECLVLRQLDFDEHFQGEDPTDAKALQWWTVLEHCTKVAEVVARNDDDLAVWVE
jgi:hypothetical protein